MITAETLWLRSQAAQQNLLQIANYNSAFFGTAMVQAMQLSITAPNAFWAAMMRVTSEPANDTVVPLAPKVAAKAQTAAKPKAAPKPRTVSSVQEPEPAAVSKPEAKKSKPKAPKASQSPASADDVVSNQNPLLLDAPRGGKADDLTTLAGVGPKLASTLNEFGIYHYDQLAGLNDKGIAWLDDQQKGFKMLVARYDIVGQAKANS